MTAAELIHELQQVHPDTPVTISTDTGSKQIDFVARMGYNDRACTIVPAE